MLLAIEQGNTNTLFAVHDGETWLAQWRTATYSTRTADEYAVWLSQLLQLANLKLGEIEGCFKTGAYQHDDLPSFRRL